jgi:hypothetical protein
MFAACKELRGVMHTAAVDHATFRPCRRHCCCWTACVQVGLDDAAVRLERSKDSFRDKVKTMLEAFLREIATMQEEFVRASPTNEGTSSRAALAFIAKWKAAVAAARQKVRGCGSQLCLFYICSRTGDVLCNEIVTCFVLLSAVLASH